MEELFARFGVHPSGLLHALRGRISDRKYRLFACACIRRVWHLMEDERSRAAVAFAERHAEHGLERRRGRPAVWEAANTALAEAIASPHFEADETAPRRRRIATDVAHAAQRLVESGAWSAASAACDAAAHALGHAGVRPDEDTPDAAGAAFFVARQREYEAQVEILRDLVGHLFHPESVILPEWRAWNGGTAARIAGEMYDAGTFPDLPVLADALEEAGCADEAILGHCRGPGLHARGCWVVDLVLGKK